MICQQCIALKNIYIYIKKRKQQRKEAGGDSERYADVESIPGVVFLQQILNKWTWRHTHTLHTNTHTVIQPQRRALIS